MRPQLFAGGVLVVIMGAVFFVLAVPLAYFWSIPFMIGGVIMILVSFFLPEGEAPLAPPEGYRFCVFCSTPVPLDAERCPHCNGYQPRLT
jgi:energy-coupling factor transporter transmembrane protein EcfT